MKVAINHIEVFNSVPLVYSLYCRTVLSVYFQDIYNHPFHKNWTGNPYH